MLRCGKWGQGVYIYFSESNRISGDERDGSYIIALCPFIVAMV
jgi:hypothetical protein